VKQLKIIIYSYVLAYFIDIWWASWGLFDYLHCNWLW